MFAYRFIVYIFSLKLGEMKDLQKLRKRPNGVSIVGLALGTKVSVEDEASGVCTYLTYLNF